MAVGGVWLSITAIDKNTRSTDRLNLACDKNESKYHIKTYSLYSCSNRVLIKYSVTMRLQSIGYKKTQVKAQPVPGTLSWRLSCGGYVIP